MIVLSGYYGDKYGFNVPEINGYVADKTFIEGNYDLETKEYSCRQLPRQRQQGQCEIY